MKTPKAKIRFFFLSYLRWRHPLVNVQIYVAGNADPRPGWWKLRINPRFDRYRKGPQPGFNISETVHDVLAKMGVPRRAWDYGPRFHDTYYIHYIYLDPGHWNKRFA